MPSNVMLLTVFWLVNLLNHILTYYPWRVDSPISMDRLFTASGQTRPAIVDQQLASVTNLPAHKIEANDLIALAVYDAPELTRTVRVGADGSIDLPLLKESIRAEGLLPVELEAAITKALKVERILVRPVVTLTIMTTAETSA